MSIRWQWLNMRDSFSPDSLRKLTFKEAMVLCFLTAVTVAYAPILMNTINTGILLPATTWMFMIAIGVLVGLLFGIFIALRMTRVVSLQFEQLTARLLETVERKFNNTGLQNIAMRSHDFAQEIVNAQDRKQTELLAKGVLWMLRKPVTQGVLMPGCCPRCQKESAIWHERGMEAIDEDSGIPIDPRYYAPEHHHAHCPVPPLYRWGTSLLSQIESDKQKAQAIAK